MDGGPGQHASLVGPDRWRDGGEPPAAHVQGGQRGDGNRGRYRDGHHGGPFRDACRATGHRVRLVTLLLLFAGAGSGAAVTYITPPRNIVYVGADSITTTVGKDGITVYVQAEDIEGDA